MYLNDASSIEDVVDHGLEPAIQLLRAFCNSFERPRDEWGGEPAVTFFNQAEALVMRSRERLMAINAEQRGRRGVT
jgi:hypothetical protein